jgi:hypothetical protein
MSCINSCICGDLLHDMKMKNRLTFLCLSGLAFVMTILSVALVFGFECHVDSHGPYDLNRKKCFKLGRQQAHTNCVLKEKQAEVELSFSHHQKIQKAVCRSHPMILTAASNKDFAKNSDCTKAVCQIAPDTAQH